MVFKTLVLVAIRDNEGRVFPKRAWRDLEDRPRTFGGFTQLGLVEVQGTAEGKPFPRGDLDRMLDAALDGIMKLKVLQDAALK